MNKIVIKFFISTISIAFFWGLESGFTQRNGYELIKSIIFASSFFIVLTKKYKQYILWISTFLLISMIILYLLWQIQLSDLLGSIGFGMFFIFILSYLPDLVRIGFVKDK